MRKLFGAVINLWVLVGAVVVGALLLGLVVCWMTIFLPLTNENNAPAAALTIIPAPTATVSGFELPTDTPPPSETPAPTPLPGTIVQGAFVQITGTGGDGLNLRSEPGLNSEVRYLGLESEVFVVRDGPQEADGLIWWYLVGFYDESRNGWAASNYLEIIQNP